MARPLSERDFEIAHALGPILQDRGLLLAGVDVIGDYVTEINVTSPTCFQEIQQQTGCDVASLFIDALEAAMNKRRLISKPIKLHAIVEGFAAQVVLFRGAQVLIWSGVEEPGLRLLEGADKKSLVLRGGE